MKKYSTIIVSYGTMRKLKMICKRSAPTIQRALKGNVTTIEHLQIREQAKALGGVEVPEPTEEKEVHNADNN